VPMMEQMMVQRMEPTTVDCSGWRMERSWVRRWAASLVQLWVHQLEQKKARCWVRRSGLVKAWQTGKLTGH
jgi:hypothetical protein